MTEPSITDVEKFWNENPLFTGEVELDEANPEAFFEAHDATYFEDVLAGIQLEKVIVFPGATDKTLDLGCGIGFWSSLFVRRFEVQNLTSADLTEEALRLCKLRVPSTIIIKENAEMLSFDDGVFDHVNCQGVIHHTPDTQKCLDEIYRVLAHGGTASVSVYYKNYLLCLADIALPLVKMLARTLLKDTGRGRDFSQVNSLDDVVRFYDGSENPIGKAYNKSQFNHMLNEAGFRHVEFDYFFFPFRFFKFRFPRFAQRFLVRLFPFMIVANIKK